MAEKLIISIIFIPINALILWIICSLLTENKSYKKTLLASAIIFCFSFLDFISFHGFHASILSNFLSSNCFKALISVGILQLVLRYNFLLTFMIWLIWSLVQIPFYILQTKILNLL